MYDHLEAFPMVLLDRDAATAGACGVRLFDILPPDSVHRRPASRARKD